MFTNRNHSINNDTHASDFILPIQQRLGEIRQAAEQLIKELSLPDDVLYEVLAIMYQQAPGEFPFGRIFREYSDNLEE